MGSLAYVSLCVCIPTRLSGKPVASCLGLCVSLAYVSLRVCIPTRLYPSAFVSLRVCIPARLYPYAYPNAHLAHVVCCDGTINFCLCPLSVVLINEFCYVIRLAKQCDSDGNKYDPNEEERGYDPRWGEDWLPCVEPLLFEGCICGLWTFLLFYFCMVRCFI